MTNEYGRRETDKEFIPLLGQQIQAVNELTGLVNIVKTQLELLPTANEIRAGLDAIKRLPTADACPGLDKVLARLVDTESKVTTLWNERLENMGVNKVRKNLLTGVWTLLLISFGVVVNDVGAFLGSAGRLLERFFSMMAGP